jgi:hypothetical protein
MPSLIGSTGYDGTVNTGVAANYLKTTPTTKFGTRQLAFFNVDVTSIESNFTDPASLYTRVVRTIQQIAEIYAIGEPTSNGFFLIVSADTLGDNSKLDPTDTTPTQAEALAATLIAAGFSSATVVSKTLVGAGTFA